ncbi:MAG: hypothetical protein NZ519_02765 [Bacteroidia bacterium]|nr:hypothetical protein [Bacteroidia bacterium]MDW8302959.1 hypothetical protein [Bacteroidia bacterium]
MISFKFFEYAFVSFCPQGRRASSYLRNAPPSSYVRRDTPKK